MSDAKSPREFALDLGLSDEEFERIVELLGREPNPTEIGIFSVMWSEHCSYKSSLVHLRKFPTQSERSLTKMGKENAGALLLKDGWALVFKIESHNHPSAIEPFQGAATGVGGILRDVFCMGAYPIACLDSLRFGEIDDPKAQHIFDGVVRGIAAYGNCFGVPTVAGEIVFDKAYSGNPLVNVMAVGIVRTDRMISAKASGVGNLVVYIGAATGRDGIHGASFASGELTESSHEKRPAVQIGDPFTEKLLLEATQEIASRGLAVGMQDMGAAGLTSSSAEMAAKAGLGVELDLDKVPLREEGMTPYEIMLSESQERMLLVTTPQNLAEVERILDKWGLHYAVVGRVIGERVLRLWWRGEVVCEIPVHALLAGEGAPVYNRPMRKPEYIDRLRERDPLVELSSTQTQIDVETLLIRLLSMPSIASKRWVWRQYDHQVGVRTVILPGAGDAAVLDIRETGQYVAVCTDGNGAYTSLDPYAGGAIAVLEAARNVASVGATPIGITDCLNFGNPEKPEVMWQFARATDGIADACRALGIPVTGGNVSFYNESPQGAALPTPVVGMVGVIDDASSIITPNFKQAGDVVIILGEPSRRLGGTALQKLLWNKLFGKPPEPRLELHRRAIALLLELVRRRAIKSAHDVSDGGIGVALAECTFGAEGWGAKIEVPNGFDPILWLFAEPQGVFVVSAAPEKLEQIERLASQYDVPCAVVGEVTDDGTLQIDKTRWKVETLRKIYEEAIPLVMDGAT